MKHACGQWQRSKNEKIRTTHTMIKPQNMYMHPYTYHRASLMAQQRMGHVKNLPTVQETQVWSRGREDPLEEAIATHSRILTRRKPHGQRSLTGYSPGGQRESDMTEEAKHIPYHSPSITEEWKWLHLDRDDILRRWKDTSLTFSKPLRRWTLNREPAQMDC